MHIATCRVNFPRRQGVLARRCKKALAIDLSLAERERTRPSFSFQLNHALDFKIGKLLLWYIMHSWDTWRGRALNLSLVGSDLGREGSENAVCYKTKADVKSLDTCTVEIELGLYISDFSSCRTSPDRYCKIQPTPCQLQNTKNNSSLLPSRPESSPCFTDAHIHPGIKHTPRVQRKYPGPCRWQSSFL